MTSNSSQKTFILDTNVIPLDSFACPCTPSTRRALRTRHAGQSTHMKSFLPDNSPLRAFVPFCLALLILATASPASQILRYREQTGDDSFTFSWRADWERDSVTVIQNQGDEIFSSVNTTEGTTLSWRFIKQPDTDVRAERKGDRIHFSGRFAGKTIDRTEAIDPRPWYQPLSFCLQRMVAREQSSADFWTIRPDTLEVLAMQAKNAGSAQIPSINGGAERTEKVVIQLDGLMSAIWQAEYWFRSSDNLFLQYRGTHGPPGTDETRIRLVTH